MSEHKIEIVELGDVVPHPNADRLDVVTIWGWKCAVSRGQFKCGDAAIYVPPDFVVPLSRTEFAFLGDGTKPTKRITVKRLRGELSQGLVIPVPSDIAHLPVGADVMEQMGISRYEPPLQLQFGGDFVTGPSGFYSPKFDVENYQRWPDVIPAGEAVVITEKIHGASARYLYHDGQQWCGSRTNWRAEKDGCPWWTAFKKKLAIGNWCEAHPGQILHGEVFGNVQDLRYGAAKSDIYFAAFAVLDKQTWMDWADIEASCADAGVPTVPVLFRGPFDPSAALAMAELDSVWPGAAHEREGVVVVPSHERRDDRIGRVILKMVSNRYLGK